MIAVLMIDGNQMPTPTSLQITMSDGDSDNTGRSESWYMNRERVRPNIMKINLGWVCESTSEAMVLYTNLSKERFTAKVHFLGETHEKVMYAGDREFKAVTLPRGDSHVEVWEVSCSLIEY